VKVFRFAAVLWTAAALGVGAWVLFIAAAPFDVAVPTSNSVALGTDFDRAVAALRSEGVALRIFAGVAAFAALFVLLRSNLWSGSLAFVVGVVGLVLVFTTAGGAIFAPWPGVLPPFSGPFTEDQRTLATLVFALAAIGGLLIVAWKAQRSRR